MDIVRSKKHHPVKHSHTPMDKFIDRFFQGWSHDNFAIMPLDIVEEKNEFIIKADIPGMESDDIDVSIENDILTISGEKKNEHEEKGDNFHHMERSYGAFRRSVQLPASVEPDKIHAKYHNGVLRLTVPKSEKTEPKKIKVNKHK